MKIKCLWVLLVVLKHSIMSCWNNWNLSWSACHFNRYEECKEKLVPFLKKVGFNPKKDIHFMPCSGLTGANLKEQSEFCPWYMYVSKIEQLGCLLYFNKSKCYSEARKKYSMVYCSCVLKCLWKYDCIVGQQEHSYAMSQIKAFANCGRLS